MARILLLQTDKQLAATAKQFFGHAGHQLSHFADPQSAVTATDRQRPDVIVIDLFLATRSGIEFLYELRSYPEWQAIPLIMTGLLPAGELQDFQASLAQLNVTKYIQKQDSTLAGLLSEVEATLQPATL